MSVHIQNSLNRRIKTVSLKRAAIRALVSERAAESEVCILLADDNLLHELNLEYRSQDKPTDVLSFAQRDSIANITEFTHNSPSAPLPFPENLGDVVISVETAERQASAHGRTLDEELCLLTVHGILHLLGYDDVSDEGADEMQRLECELGVRR